MGFDTKVLIVILRFRESFPKLPGKDAWRLGFKVKVKARCTHPHKTYPNSPFSFKPT